MIIINDKCIALIKEFESFRSHAYHGELDPPKLFTIGYGTTIYPNGMKVTLEDKPITEEQATEYLLHHIKEEVCRPIDNYLRDDLSGNQFGALLSFVYNCGASSFRSSTLLKRVNVNPIDVSIRDSFMMWVKAEGVDSPGLKRRRVAEADLYFTP